MSRFTSYHSLIFSIFFLLPLHLQSQVGGCTDPMATNHNGTATYNDGTCMYATTTYNPPIKVDPITDSLRETSGLMLAGGSLWSFNDGGGTPTLYRIDTLTNALLQRVILLGVANKDWEDIAYDGENVYIGDFGNNVNGARTDLKVLKFRFDMIPQDYAANLVAYVPANNIEIINFKYADQPQPPVAVALNTTRYDCAAMLVENGKIHLFSKDYVDNTCTHYVINDTSAGNYVAMPTETLATNYLVTGASKIAGQNIIVLLGYQNSGSAAHFLHILSDYNGDNFFSGNKRKIDLPDVLTMGQAEGITFKNGKYGYISNERFSRTVGPFSITVNQKLRSFDISNFVNDYYTTFTFTGNGNWSDSTNWQYKLMPPVSLIAGNSIIIDPVENGKCILDIPYQLTPGASLSVKENKSFVVNGNLILQ